MHWLSKKKQLFLSVFCYSYAQLKFTVFCCSSRCISAELCFLWLFCYSRFFSFPKCGLFPGWPPVEGCRFPVAVYFFPWQMQYMKVESNISIGKQLFLSSCYSNFFQITFKKSISEAFSISCSAVKNLSSNCCDRSNWFMIPFKLALYQHYLPLV